MTGKLKYFLFIFLTVFSGHLFAWSLLNENIDIKCSQPKEQLSCNYRLLNNEKVNTISAKSGGKEITFSSEIKNDESNLTSAILFLVDTSDPARQNVVDKNKEHIKKLISNTNPSQKLGLGSFDKTFKIHSPIGTTGFLIKNQLDSLKATGKTTELYRNLLNAIRLLNRTDADRKLIVLFSDGQAEDKAYFHSDVVNAARKHGIVINSIGYPRSVSLSVALQTIRRISEETGGNYIETDNKYGLPQNYFSNAFENINTGGRFIIDTSQLENENISLNIKTVESTENITIPVRIKQKAKPVTTTVVQAPSTETTVKTPATEITRVQPQPAPVQIITRQVESQPINLWLWYGLPAAFIIIIIFILITLFLLWHREPQSKKDNSTNEYKPYAYLIAKDELSTRYPITRTIWRIGRSRDNELTLNDTSVSRRHAEIHRNNNGSFDIVDMNSMNGIYINDEKVNKAILEEGDMIEIGDIFLHFTQFGSDYSQEESTVMQNTKAPH